MSQHDASFAGLMEEFLKVPGIVDVILLPRDLRKEILASETKEECEAGGFFTKYNAGLREVLKREHMVAILTNDLYKYPPEPMELVCLGETVGEEIKDKEQLKQFAKDPNNMILGDSFVIFKDKLPRSSLRKAQLGEIKIFLPPMSVGVKDVKGVYGLVLGMPSTHTDIFLKSWLKCQGVDLSNERYGVILVGFNIMG
ncbi:MAG: hypothetical protein ABSF36_08830 [Candidatus Methanomethylicaceae archaeon]